MEKKLPLPLGWKTLNWFETKHRRMLDPKKGWCHLILLANGTKLILKTDYCVHAHFKKKNT